MLRRSICCSNYELLRVGRVRRPQCVGRASAAMRRQQRVGSNADSVLTFILTRITVACVPECNPFLLFDVVTLLHTCTEYRTRIL